MGTYTVVALYDDNGQRWAQAFVAKSVEEAERMAERAVEADITIAGVIEGAHEVS